MNLCKAFCPQKICLYVVALTLACTLALSGCGGPSKEEKAKEDVKGKQTNEDAMKRMLQEQGKGGMPGQPGGGMPGQPAQPGGDK